MIRGILFDAAGVLYDRPAPTREYLSNLLKGMGLSGVLPDKSRVHQKALRSQANKGQISPSDYWDQVLLMMGVSSPEERAPLVDKINAYSDQVQAIPGGTEALAGLRRRGFVLGIVTDTIYPLERKMRWLEKVGVASYIDVIACSTVVGAYKPDPAIYLDALRKAHLAPAETAFVGHDAEELDGARRAGMATVAVNYDSDAKADYYADSLVDLLAVPIFAKANLSSQ